MWTVLYHAPVKASYRYRGDVQIVADCVIMSPLGVATRGVTANRQVRNPRMGVSTKLVGGWDGTEIGGHNPLFFLFLGIILDIY